MHCHLPEDVDDTFLLEGELVVDVQALEQQSVAGPSGIAAAALRHVPVLPLAGGAAATRGAPLPSHERVRGARPRQGPQEEENGTAGGAATGNTGRAGDHSVVRAAVAAYHGCSGMHRMLALDMPTAGMLHCGSGCQGKAARGDRRLSRLPYRSKDTGRSDRYHGCRQPQRHGAF